MKTTVKNERGNIYTTYTAEKPYKIADNGAKFFKQLIVLGNSNIGYFKFNEMPHGMNWITQEKRLAIYLRDGLACAYCGQSITDEGTQLSLDHLKPRSEGGKNEETNLITACLRCNSSRGNRSYIKFASAVAQYINHGTTAKKIISHIKACLKRPLDIATAKEMVERRGSCKKVLESL